MTHSIIVNGIIKAAKYIISIWENSVCFKFLQKLDKFLSKAAKESFFAKVFTIHNENSIIKYSIIVRGISALINKFFSAGTVFTNKIQDSFCITLFKNIFVKAIKNPLRTGGIFLSAFMVSNILFDILLNGINILTVLIKVFLLIVSALAIFLNIDIEQLINESKFIKLCKWFISCEN